MEEIWNRLLMLFIAFTLSFFNHHNKGVMIFSQIRRCVLFFFDGLPDPSRFMHWRFAIISVSSSNNWLRMAHALESVVWSSDLLEHVKQITCSQLLGRYHLEKVRWRLSPSFVVQIAAEIKKSSSLIKAVTVFARPFVGGSCGVVCDLYHHFWKCWIHWLLCSS